MARGQRTHRKCESSGANRFSGGLEDWSARARSFRLKSEWTKSAPGPRVLLVPPPTLTFVLVSPTGLHFLSPILAWWDGLVGSHQSTQGAYIFCCLCGHGYAWLFRLFLFFVVLFRAADCIVDPVAIRDEVLSERGFTLLAVFACLNNVATDALNYTKAPGPFGGRGEWQWFALR